MSRQLPLTFQQLWLFDFVQTHQRWQCVAANVFRLRGALDIPLLRQCLNEAVQRNDALRTRIVSTGAIALQEILDIEEYPLQVVQISGSCVTHVESNARRLVEEVCDERMDLSSGPLWRAMLLELSGHEYWLVLAMHRLIGDCASIEQTYRAIQASYFGRSEGQPIPIEYRPQYSDYTAWQQRTSSEWASRHEPYWRRRLDGAKPLEWPTDRHAAGGPIDVLRKVSCSFGATLGRDLHGLARELRTLSATVMLAIYVVVLWRWCRNEDFVLPFNVAGRATEYKSAVGYFSCVLYLRMSVTGNEIFKDFVKSVGNEFFGSLAHPDFGRIARQRPELLSGTLFQWLTWQSEDTQGAGSSTTSDLTRPAFERVRVRDFGEGLTVAPPGITSVEITVFDTATGLRAFGSYRSDQFTAHTMERFMCDLRSMTEFLVRNPDARIGEIVEAGGDVDGAAEQEVGEDRYRADAIT